MATNNVFLQGLCNAFTLGPLTFQRKKLDPFATMV